MGVVAPARLRERKKTTTPSTPSPLSCSHRRRLPGRPALHPRRPQAAVDGVIDGQGGRDLGQGGAQAAVEAARALGRHDRAQRPRNAGCGRGRGPSTAAAARRRHLGGQAGADQVEGVGQRAGGQAGPAAAGQAADGVGAAAAVARRARRARPAAAPAPLDPGGRQLFVRPKVDGRVGEAVDCRGSERDRGEKGQARESKSTGPRARPAHPSPPPSSLLLSFLSHSPIVTPLPRHRAATPSRATTARMAAPRPRPASGEAAAAAVPWTW